MSTPDGADDAGGSEADLLEESSGNGETLLLDRRETASVTEDLLERRLLKVVLEVLVAVERLSCVKNGEPKGGKGKGDEPAHQTLENANGLLQLLDVDLVALSSRSNAEDAAADTAVLDGSSTRSENMPDEKELEELVLVPPQVELRPESVELGGDRVIVVRGAGAQVLDDCIAEDERLELRLGFRGALPARWERGGG